MKRVFLLFLVISLVLTSSNIIIADDSSPSDEYLLNQERSLEILDDLMNYNEFDKHMKYPDYYAGSYLDADGNLNIMVTDLSQEVLENISIGTNEAEITIHQARYSLNQMLDIIETINTSHEDLSKQDINVQQMYKDQEYNTVFIYIDQLNDEKISIISRYIDIEVVTFKEAEKVKEDHVSLYGGGRISDQIGGDSSLGFSAVRQKWISGSYYLTQYGFIITGHAPDFQGEDIYFRGAIAGDVDTIMCQGDCDAAFVVKRSSTTLTNDILTTRELNSAVSSSYTYPKNTYVIMSGKSSNARVGKIIDDSASDTFTSGYFYDLVYADYFAQGGDSGGTVSYVPYSGADETLLGIHKGGIGTESYFVKYTIIKNKFNLDAVVN